MGIILLLIRNSFSSVHHIAVIKHIILNDLCPKKAKNEKHSINARDYAFTTRWKYCVVIST